MALTKSRRKELDVQKKVLDFEARLDPVHRRFVELYLSGTYTMSGAWQECYPDSKKSSASSSSSRCFNRPEIKEYAAYKARLPVAQLIVNETNLILRLWELANSKEPKSGASCVSACTAIAKIIGVGADRHEHTGKDGGPIENTTQMKPGLTRETTQEIVAGALGLDPTQVEAFLDNKTETE